MQHRFLAFAVLFLALLPATSAGGLNQGVTGTTPEALFPWGRFDPAIPTQETATGIAPAERPLRPEEVLAYYRLLAQASPRATLFEYARTYEDRPLVYLAVSDPETISHLNAFKTEHAALMDPRTGRNSPANAKAVAWVAYGIHGDELSSTDAAASLAYWLVAGEDDRAKTLRDKLVVLIDPCENPDGRSRYLAMTTSFAHRTANPDGDDLSHAAAWPWGRGNHYLFDMNRDWFTQVLPESARSSAIAGWIPQLMVDSHEMGPDSTYLFPPPRHPFNPLLPPNTRKWEGTFSDNQAAALDGRGFPYFTGEWNEEFFPGYGSSWASYHGAVGILYEMSRTSGILVKKHGGTVRTFAQAVEHHVTSSVSNLESLAAHAGEILADQVAARKKAIDLGQTGKLKAWLFPADPEHPERLDRFASLLTGQGIEVMKLGGSSTQAKGAVDARTGVSSTTTLEPGSLMVVTAQPAGYLARVLLDPHVPMETGFFQDEREYLEKDKGSRLYETTAWSLILGWGLPARWSGALPGGEWKPWSPGTPSSPALVTGPFNSIIMDGNSDNAPAALAAMQQAGIRVRIAEKPFTIQGKSFDRGAMVIRKEGNIDHVGDAMNRIASEFGLNLFPVATARAEAGPDLGGSHYPVLIEPRVGVLTGMPVSPTDYGSIWHLLDQDLNLRFSAVDAGRMSRIDLTRYNVLVFPPVFGGAGMYRQLLGPGGMEKLRQWIEAGGTAIGIGGGARMLADQDSGLTVARFRSQALESFPPPVWSIPASVAEAAGRTVATGLRLPKAADGKEKGPSAPEAGSRSPYDVAPVLGAGAKPFAEGYDQGTPLKTRPEPMAEWISSVLPAGKKNPGKEEFQAADARLRKFMPQGVMLRADLDLENWLNYGLGKSITVWFGGADTLIASPPVSVAARFPDIDRLQLGGLLWPEAAARIAGTGYATRESRGRGQVILFADHPAYRRWMKESERMLMNAVLYGPGLGTRWSTPW